MRSPDPDSRTRAASLFLASRNPGKLAEFRALLAPLGWSVDAPGPEAAPAPEETGADFEENAAIKALAAPAAGRPVLADDSGLSVPALGGEPGVRSARYAGSGADDAANNRLLLERLAGLPRESRRAVFVCVLALALPNGEVKTFRGETAGTILESPRGSGGFGYDPLFLSEDLGLTFAEADPAAKNRVSHRARAMKKLAEYLGNRD